MLLRAPRLQIALPLLIHARRAVIGTSLLSPRLARSCDDEGKATPAAHSLHNEQPYPPNHAPSSLSPCIHIHTHPSVAAKRTMLKLPHL